VRRARQSKRVSEVRSALAYADNELSDVFGDIDADE
jgi:hypothetical protein